MDHHNLFLMGVLLTFIDYLLAVMMAAAAIMNWHLGHKKLFVANVVVGVFGFLMGTYIFIDSQGIYRGWWPI